ncbi:hypothetical protein ABH970_004921 [Bradyrhizobium ottawaense]
MKDTLRRFGAEPAVLRRKEERRHARVERAVEGEMDRNGRRSGLGRTDIACNERCKRDRESQQATQGGRLES